MSESIGRSLYVCTTPFQIMTCISKVLTDKEEADLLVDPQFCDAESIMERLRQEHIFRRVINTGESKRLCSIRKKEGLVRKLSLSVALVGGRRLYRDILQGEEQYSCIYASSNNEVTRYLMNYVLKRSWDTEFAFFDDGEGSYDDNVEIGLGRNRRSFVNRLLVREIGDKSVRRYLYFPNLYRNLHPEFQGEIIQLPKWSDNESLKEVFDRLFRLNEIEDIDERFIVLDILEREVFGEEEGDRYKQVIDRICQSVGVENVRIKRHPRDKRVSESGVKEIKERGVPLECLISKFGEDEKVLIALTSTATFLPKALLGKEYYIVLLYRLFSVNLGEEEQRDKYYEYLKNSYVDRGRVMIPGDEGELFTCIENLKALVQKG